jgi:hypothetical protein
VCAFLLQASLLFKTNKTGFHWQLWWYRPKYPGHASPSDGYLDSSGWKGEAVTTTIGTRIRRKWLLIRSAIVQVHQHATQHAGAWESSEPRRPRAGRLGFRLQRRGRRQDQGNQAAGRPADSPRMTERRMGERRQALNQGCELQPPPGAERLHLRSLRGRGRINGRRAMSTTAATRLHEVNCSAASTALARGLIDDIELRHHHSPGRSSTRHLVPVQHTPKVPFSPRRKPARPSQVRRKSPAVPLCFCAAQSPIAGSLGRKHC